MRRSHPHYRCATCGLGVAHVSPHGGLCDRCFERKYPPVSISAEQARIDELLDLSWLSYTRRAR